MLKYVRTLALLTVVLTFLCIDQSIAQDIGDISDNLYDEGKETLSMLFQAAIVIGVALTIFGLFKLKAYVDAPDQTPIQVPLMILAVAGMLFTIPWVMETSQKTVGYDSTGLVTRDVISNDMCNKRTQMGGGMVAAPGGANNTVDCR